MAYSPARVFASLMPAPGEVCVEERGPGTVKAPYCRCRGSGRLVEVTGSAELSAAPDRATVSVAVSHRKESVSDCNTSVTRRLEYILQTLRQNGIKEEDFSVMKNIQRDQDLYRAQAEVNVVFSDFEKMQHVRSVLIEKLDKSVCVGDPSFSHSSECLSLLRRRVCAAAVETARLKALEVCNMLGQALGRPLLVREEESREWRAGQRESLAAHQTQQLKVGQTVSASSQVFVTFELRPKDGTRKRS